MNPDKLKDGIVAGIGCARPNLTVSDRNDIAFLIMTFLENTYDMEEKQKPREQIAQEVKNHLLDGMDVIRAYFDGNGNKDMIGYAQWRIYWPDGSVDPGSHQHQGLTNNQLEYCGLISCMEKLLGEANNVSDPKVKIEKDISIMGDSKLVVEQVNGRWRVNEKHFIEPRDKALKLLSQLKQAYRSVELKWVSKKVNLVDAHA